MASKSVDTRIKEYIEGYKINQLELTDSFLNDVSRFMAVANAKDERAILINAKKKRSSANESKHYQRELVRLMILANIDCPTQSLVDALFEEDLDNHDDLELENRSTYINIINNQRHELKRIVPSLFKSKANLSLMQCVSSYMSIKGFSSLENRVIDCYRDVIDCWMKPCKNKPWKSWDDAIKSLDSCDRKNRDYNFLTQLSKYPRSLLEIYIIVCSTHACMTDEDIRLITNGKKISEERFFEILQNIKLLTKKR